MKLKQSMNTRDKINPSVIFRKKFMLNFLHVAILNDVLITISKIHTRHIARNKKI
jgi:hypothetical protein